MGGARLEKVSNLKYLVFVLEKSSTCVPEFCGKGASRRKVAGAIISLVNARGL